METVSRPSTNTFSDHSLSIIHVHKYNNPVNNQNPVSKKIQDTDINRLNNSTINRNKYYYSNNFEHNNGKTVTLKETYLMQKVQLRRMCHISVLKNRSDYSRNRLLLGFFQRQPQGVGNYFKFEANK